MNRSVKPTARGRGRGWWNQGQQSYASPNGIGNIVSESTPGLIHNGGNSSRGGENVLSKPTSLGRGELMRKFINQKNNKGTTANNANHVNGLDMQYSNSGIDSSPSHNSLHQKTNDHFTSPSVQSNSTFTSPSVQSNSTFTSPSVQCNATFTSPSVQSNAAFTSQSVQSNATFTSPSVQSTSNTTFTSVLAPCDSTSTNYYHNNQHSSYQPADSSISPNNSNVTHSNLSNMRQGTVTHSNLSNSNIIQGTVTASCDINTAASCDNIKPDSSSNSSYQDQVISDNSTGHINTDNDHKHNMYCSSVVCVTEVDKFVPEGHLAMLIKWIAHIMNVWNIWKQSNFFSDNVKDFFNTFPDPYSSTVYLLVEIPGEKSKNSKGLFLAVLNLFHSWIESKKELKAHYLHYELKRILLKKWLLISCPDSLRKVRLAFQCDNEQSWIVNELLPKLKQNHKYREIRILAQEFELYSQVSIMDFLVPFVFQNKLVYVEESLKCYSQFQVPLLKYLDELLNCRNLDSRVKQIAKEQDIPEVKFDSLRYKPLSKLIVRLMKEFKIPQTACANVLGNKKKATLAFVVEKYFVAKSLNVESWREMALDIVKDNSNLQKELVEICVDHYDCKEAYYWCQKFKLNPNIPGFDLRDKILEEEKNQMLETCWNTRQLEYYSVCLPPEHILLVDTCEKLALTLQYFARLDRNSCLGIDTEWKPNLSGSSPASLALIQIATRDRVYILDIVSLSKFPKFNDLCLELELILFANDDLLKIGFNLMPDVNIIKTCLPFSESVSFNEKSYLDLQLLWSKLIAETNIQFPYKEEHPVVGPQSLSTLVYKCFGKHLNKQDQFSNWENRPLRESQVQYAALDALCLVQVYDVLAALCAEQGVELVPLVMEVLSSNVAAAKKATAKKRSKKKSMPPPPNKEPVSPQQVAFMCDVTLKSLGRMLRQYGMDTTCAVSDNAECVAAIKQGEKERYLLTRGSGYGQLTCHVPPGHCLRIESATVPEQFEEVLSYYNVILPSIVEPRCEECNGAEFSHLDRVDALKLLELTKPTSTPQQLAHAIELEFDTSCRVNDTYYDRVNDPYYDELDDFDEDDYDRDEDALPPPINKLNTMNTTQQKLDPQFGYTKKNVTIKIDDLPLEVIEQKSVLKVCDYCGVIAL